MTHVGKAMPETTHDWGMVNIPHIFMVMTGGWFMIVLPCFTHITYHTFGDHHHLFDTCIKPSSRHQLLQHPQELQRQLPRSTSASGADAGVEAHLLRDVETWHRKSWHRKSERN
jgi:hypothetical protein